MIMKCLNTWKEVGCDCYQMNMGITWVSHDNYIDERFVLPNEDVFHVQLYSPTSWEPVPTAK